MNDEMLRLTSFDFRLLQDVRIRDMGVTGRVMARMERPGGVFEYRVVWWQESKRNDEWLYWYELEAL